MHCKYCHSEVQAQYRVNQRGDFFCNDDCYDEYIDPTEQPPDDFSHPYIDDYELMRSNYLDWLEHWESDLVHYKGAKLALKKTEMLETMDEVFEEYWDYYISEGDDGVFAKEIYFYLLKFEDLKKKINHYAG
ncbi:hypothetical protein AABM38_02955 [Heyndrickxia sp. MSNUG]|uniref:hypothetical protein n=1 Tax=Heyndrickxia sp. MSNUG TaxID=3136677 RepID=UPI003C2C864A